MVRIHRQRSAYRACGLLLAGALTAMPSPAQQTEAFARATVTFQSGDYARALELFEAVRAGGTDSIALRYNIGVSQYRTGRYAEAATTFDDLKRRFPELAALASYNQGLALLALGDTAAARTEFERAHRDGDATLSRLATEALATTAPATEPGQRWNAAVDLAAGHDDNVALVDELSLPGTISASSAFTEIHGYATRLFGRRTPLRLALSGYSVHYADAAEFDQDALRLETAFERSVGGWHLETGPHFAETLLDGAGFERNVGISLKIRRPLTVQFAFTAHLSYDDLEAPSSQFDFVSGTRERLRLGLDSRFDRYHLRFGYEIENNERMSASVSPSRRRLVVSVGHRLDSRWTVDGTLAYRRSDYDQLVTPRAEQLMEVVATARRNFRNGWLVGTEYRLADNDSSVSQFSYRSHRLSVTAGWSF